MKSWKKSIMALSIKNEKTIMAVAKMPAMTGLSMTEAIRQAVEEKLARFVNSGRATPSLHSQIAMTQNSEVST